MKQAESVKNSNPKGHPHQAAMTRSVVAGSSVVALWRTSALISEGFASPSLST
jgi:hypothetical protein